LKNNLFIPQKRRGLSSIVGALLFVVLMVATFAVLGVALDSQTDIVDTGREVADIGLKKQQEHFVIDSVVQAPGDNLELNVKNVGNNPTEIFTLVMTNSSDVANNHPTKTIDIPSDTSFLPPGTDDSTDIVDTLNLKMKSASADETDTYQFKVISSLGIIEKFNLVCDETGYCAQSIGGVSGTGDLAVQLFLDGPNGVNTKTSTIIMFVSNTGDGDIKEIWPDTSCPTIPLFPTITPAGGLEDFTSCTTTPAIDADPSCGDGVSGACLVPGQTMIFKFDGTVSGDVGDVFKFCNSVTGKQLDDTSVSSNTDCDELEVIDPNDCGGCEGGGEGGERLIVLDDLLIRPSIFLTIPSPFGMATDGDDLGIWGVNIANPTNSTMLVSKVTVTAFAPGASENTLVFDDGAGNNENINPPGAGLGDWHLNAENVMVWKNFASPVTLGPFSNESFLIKVKPEEKLLQLESIIVQASVFTTSGSFGKSGYQTTMFKENISGPGCVGCNPIGNVFLTDVVDSKANANIFAHRDNIVNGSQQNFAVTFADMDGNDNTSIELGAQIIINVPRDWENVSVFPNSTNILYVPNADPELAEPSIKKHGDGTYQIIATTDTHLGNSTNPDTATVAFTAKAPNKVSENMHIMYVLGNGISQTGHSVGPLSEVVLHVIGNVTGYP
jgi:hypothetical protein